MLTLAVIPESEKLEGTLHSLQKKTFLSNCTLNGHTTTSFHSKISNGVGVIEQKGIYGRRAATASWYFQGPPPVAPGGRKTGVPIDAKRLKPRYPLHNLKA